MLMLSMLRSKSVVGVKIWSALFAAAVMNWLMPFVAMATAPSAADAEPSLAVTLPVVLPTTLRRCGKHPLRRFAKPLGLQEPHSRHCRECA